MMFQFSTVGNKRSDVETSLYYCNSRYYNPDWCRWLNADDVSYLDPESINGLNLYAYCGNNPVMGYDPYGTFDWGKFGMILGSAAMIVGGIVLCATGLGGIAGGVLLGAGAGSLINGYVTEANGGSFGAGWLGGAVSGALCGVGAGLGGLAFSAASNAVNMACIGYLGLGIGASFAGGFLGNMTGTLITAGIDRQKVDMGELVLNSTVLGALNIFAGIASGISSIVGDIGKTAIDVNSKWAARILAGTIAGGTEAFYDAASYFYNWLVSHF